MAFLLEATGPDGNLYQVRCDLNGYLIFTGWGASLQTQSVTAIQVNTGVTLIAANGSTAVTVTGFSFMASGGNFGGATSLQLQDSSGVVVATILAAALTQDTQVTAIASANVVLPNMLTPLTSGAGLRLVTVGGSMTGATSIKYAIQFTQQ